MNNIIINRDEKTPITYREAIREAMLLEMSSDESVFLMGEEVGQFEGAYKVSAGLLKEFGEKRVIDTPISEEGFLGAGIGAAMAGQRPIIEIMTINFTLVAMDQIINHAAKIGAMFGGKVRCPMVVRTPAGAGNQLTAQHSQSLEVWFASTPGLKVVAPSSPEDAKGLLQSAIRDNDPVVFVENLSLYNKSRGIVPVENIYTPIGKARRVNEGADISIISHGYSTFRVQALLEEFSSQGVYIDLMDLRSLRPLDMETIVESVEKCNRVLLVEEGWPTYGVTAELATRIQEACFDSLDAPVQRIGALEVPLPYAKNLETAVSPNEERLRNAINRTLELSGLVKPIKQNF